DRSLQRQVSWRYDSIGRKQEESHRDTCVETPTAQTQTYTFYYDGASRRDPDARTDRGLLTSVEGDGYVKLFQYRADGKLSRRTLALLDYRTVGIGLDWHASGPTPETTQTVRKLSGVT